jgi:hypothetical protein
MIRNVSVLPYMYISEKTPQKETDLKKYMGVLEK